MLEKYLDIFNILSYQAVIIDHENNPIWANKKFLSVHNIKKNKLEELEVKLVIKAMILEGLKNNECKLEIKNVTHYFQPILSSIDDKFSLVSFFDVSKNIQLQNKIKEKQEMFERLSEYLPEGIVLFQDNIVYSNPVFEKLIGYSGKELGKTQFYNLIKQTEQEQYKESMQRLLEGKKSTIDTTLQLITKKENYIWVKIKTKLLLQDEKKYFLNIVTNISKEKLEVQKLHDIAYFDALTGIHNRRKFNELMVIEYKRAKRYNRVLSAIFFDIDHFKSINDTFGHDIGDEVLITLSKLVKSHVRETDIFARWGGEEFIILLPETDVDNALIYAENVRNSVSDFTFSKVNNITVSIGITNLKGKEHIDTFLKRLDNGLYRAKKEGRNRSIIQN